MENRPLVFVGIGEVLWDLLPGGRQFGGAPANFAYHAKALGADAQVVSCVGRDDLGDEILTHLDRLGLGHDYVSVNADHPTGTVSVQLDTARKPEYVIHEQVAWDYLELLPQSLGLAARADAVCFGSLAQRFSVSRVAIREFLAATGPECLRVFDINLRQHYYNVDTIAVGLESADVLKLNDEELPTIAGLLSIRGTTEELLGTLCRRYNLKLIALTEGERGSLLFTTTTQSRHGGHRTEVVDSVGAGDAFTAVLAFGLLSGASLDAINEQANRVASFVCSRAGATPEMPPAEEVVREDWPQMPAW
jgi:fructokinase